MVVVIIWHVKHVDINIVGNVKINGQNINKMNVQNIYF